MGEATSRDKSLTQRRLSAGESRPASGYREKNGNVKEDVKAEVGTITAARVFWGFRYVGQEVILEEPVQQMILYSTEA